jgi:hypothetical protein
MTLPLKAKKWLLHESTHQQQEGDKTKKLLPLSKYKAVSKESETNNSSTSNQYASVKNVAKG